MLWSNIRSWTKEKGYKTERKKIISGEEDEEETSYLYKWSKITDETICGETTSVSKLAKIIYNDITNNIHIEHQESYVRRQKEEF